MAPWILVVLLGIGGLVLYLYLATLHAERIRKEFELLMEKLRDDPVNPVVHGMVLRTLQDTEFAGLTASQSELAYSTALSILAEHPDNVAAATFALAVGRWHFGRNRTEKRPTTYDEQAIQNDILVRCRVTTKSVPPAAVCQ